MDRASSREPGHADSAALANVDLVNASADAVLAVDMTDLRLQDRVPQVILGLCRAAFVQSKAIAALTAAGIASSAAPNKRLFLEILLRLHWLHSLTRDDRRRAVDTMLEKDRKETNATLDYLADAGHEADFDPAEMNAYLLDPADKGSLHQQVTRLAEAVRAPEVTLWAVYAMWKEETKFAHASATLAGHHAPTLDGMHVFDGRPDPTDPDLEAHQLIQSLLVLTAGRLLLDEGFDEEMAWRIPAAFFAT